MSDDSTIYLDHNATTPLDPAVFEAMRVALCEEFGNPASRQHRLGARAAATVERARADVAAVLGADPREIVWTSGATESNNLALKGVAHAPAYAGREHVITAVTEHKAVLDPCETLEREGRRVTRLPVDGGGLLDLQRLEDAIDERTLLVSVMHANNETGVLQPVAEIGALCKRRGVLFHCDATQSVGREPVDVEAAGIDLLSLSAHKLYGPKGVGALFVRRRGPRVRCAALFDGGGHERGLRSGTLNVPGIVGLAQALVGRRDEMSVEMPRQRALRDRLERELLGRISGVSVNGDPASRLANTSNLSFAAVDAESLMQRMPSLAVSSSAACTSASLQPSYVLAALGLQREAIDGSLRFSLGRGTSEGDLERALDMVTEAVARERAEGPLSSCRPQL